MNWSLSICCSPSICYSKYLSKCHQNRSCSFVGYFSSAGYFFPPWIHSLKVKLNCILECGTPSLACLINISWSLSSKYICSLYIFCPLHPKQVSQRSSVYILSTCLSESQTSVTKVHRVWSFLKIVVLITFLLDVSACSSPKSKACIKRMNTGFDYFLKTSLSRTFLLSPYMSPTSSC